MFPTSRTFVAAVQVRTLAVVPLTEPVTTSLKIYVPIPETNPAVNGEAIVIVGATVYPEPAFVM